MQASGTQLRKPRARAVQGITDLSTEAQAATRGFSHVIGMDEVGRGCIAGPVAVGAVLFSLPQLLVAKVPAGIADSKQLSARARTRGVQLVKQWACASAIGWASPAEIDEHGITSALALCGQRALAAVLPHAEVGGGPDTNSEVRPVVFLDGKHDWLSTQVVDVPPVEMFIKGDGRVASIAAASIIAKVARDEQMHALAQQVPGYGWDSNVGYPSPAHKAALKVLGPSAHHRLSFRLA